jgi:hypothetical protein
MCDEKRNGNDHQAGIDLLNLAAPFALMKFTLTYSGSLLASGNKPKPAEVWAIRNAIHPQLAELWQTHPVLTGLGVYADATVTKPLDLSAGRPPSWAPKIEKNAGGADFSWSYREKSKNTPTSQ